MLELLERAESGGRPGGVRGGYGKEPVEAEPDVRTFCRRLHERGLIEITLNGARWRPRTHSASRSRRRSRSLRSGRPARPVRRARARAAKLAARRSWTNAGRTRARRARWSAASRTGGSSCIRSHPEAGFRIWAPRHGRHLVSPDGTAIQSALPRSNTPRLAAAVLRPDAAARGRAAGPRGAARERSRPRRRGSRHGTAGTGKSTLAAHLVAAGASFPTTFSPSRSATASSRPTLGRRAPASRRRSCAR